jgi:hypothetical protein
MSRSREPLWRRKLDQPTILESPIRDASVKASRISWVTKRWSYSVVRERRELSLQLRTGQRVQCSKRLVHQHDWRIGGQRSGNTNALTLTARQLARIPVSEYVCIEPNQFEELADPLASLLLGPAFQPWDHRNVALDGEVRK